MELIDKSTLVAEIEKRRDAALTRQQNLESIGQETVINKMVANELNRIISIIGTLEVKDPYELWVQYPSVKDAIQAHAEIYSFNIESELFNQLTKEQQALWRKEIEQACISGGYSGLNLAKDPRYKENLEVKEVDSGITFEDISTLRQIMFDYNRQVRNEMSIPNDEEYCKEVLSRFKAQKEK